MAALLSAHVASGDQWTTAAVNPAHNKRVISFDGRTAATLFEQNESGAYRRITSGRSAPRSLCQTLRKSTHCLPSSFDLDPAGGYGMPLDAAPTNDRSKNITVMIGANSFRATIGTRHPFEVR